MKRHPAVVAVSWIVAGPLLVIGGVLYAFAAAMLVLIPVAALIGLLIGVAN